MSDSDLEEAERSALVQTKDLMVTGRHRAHAAMPVFRLCGPLVAAAIDAGINFLSLLKKPPLRTPAVNVDWPVSSFYPPEV